MEEVVETPPQQPTLHLFSYLKDCHHIVRACAVFDVASLCKAEKKDIATFIEVNCTPQDRGNINLSSMTTRDLIRHAAAILVPQQGTALPPTLLMHLSPYGDCSEAQLLMLAQRMRLFPESRNNKTKRPALTRNVLLYLMAKGDHHRHQQPVTISMVGERCRRAATERCLRALEESFEGARYKEECNRFLDWTCRDAVAHRKAGILLDRIQWLQRLDIHAAREAARYLSRHIVPFLLLRPDLILSDHACWEALYIDRKLQPVSLVTATCKQRDKPQVQKYHTTKDQSDSEEEGEDGDEVEGGFFQRLSWTDDSQLREPQRLALDALRATSPVDSSSATTTNADSYRLLIDLRMWFARVLHTTFSGFDGEECQQEGDHLFSSLSALRQEVKLSALPRMVVLPTGIGKSGVICLAPFTAKKKPQRVLVVCPSVVIREQLATCFTTFYGQRTSLNEYPRVVEIDGTWDSHKEEIRSADVHVTTFHRLTGNDLLAKFPRLFFDLILVDEAHHAEALTYQLLREHFVQAQFIYFTGTPYRSDHVPLRAQIVYSCTMKDALLHDPPYIKRLCYLPLPVRSLTLRSQSTGEDRTFSSFHEVEEHSDDILGALGLSLEAKAHLIGFAIWKLKQMRLASGVHHQAILQASDTSEAESLVALWCAHPENKHARFTIASIHSGIAREEAEAIVKQLKCDKLDAIVHVGMIGEGFDQPHLSLCCNFKRFATMPPVVQLLGRILRRIPGVGDAANLGYVLAHPGLGFHKHWELYKREDEFPDDSCLKLSGASASTLWTDLEETYCYGDELKHADWFC